MQRIIVAITGASGTHLGFKLLKYIPKDIQVYCVVSKSAKKSLKCESKKIYKDLQNVIYLKDKDLSASIASGSFQTNSMIIVPCSMNTLAKCSVGISDSLITRAFSVMLKEGKKVILAPREMPFNTIQLENMLKLSKCGVSIAPPILGYYSDQQTLEDMEDFIIGKWLDLLNIKHNLYKRWK
jgi:4-hydroxy-3-polyprenylbenzoate decarboxylase